jgi:hypothetical protein
MKALSRDPDDKRLLRLVDIFLHVFRQASYDDQRARLRGWNIYMLMLAGPDISDQRTSLYLLRLAVEEARNLEASYSYFL